MLPLVTEFSLSLPEFSRFLKIFGGCDTPPLHTPPVATPLIVCAELFLRHGALIRWHLGQMLKSVFPSILVPFIELVLPLSREETCQGYNNLTKIHC